MPLLRGTAAAALVAALLGCAPEPDPTPAARPTPAPVVPRAAGIRATAGRIVDALGSPIADCSVSLLAPTRWESGPATSLAEGRTGPDGRFALTPPPGMVGEMILVTHPRFPPRLLDAARLGAASPDLEDVVLTSAVGVTVQVESIEPPGGRVEDARVTVEPALVDPSLPPAALRRTGRTGSDGRAEIYALLPGTHRIRVEAAGLAVAEVVHAQPLVPPPPTVRVLLAPGFGVEGRVLDGLGGRVKGARVEARPDRHGAGTVSARTGDDGAFRLAGLARGRHLLEVVDEVGRSTRRTVTVPRPDVLAFTLGPRPDFTGQVAAAEDGHGIAGAEVRLRQLSAAASPSEWVAHTGLDGRFTIPGVLPGRYELWTTSDARMPACSAPLEFPSPQSIAVILEGARTLRGTVRDASGRALPGAEIEVMPEWFDGSAFSDFARQLDCGAQLGLRRSGPDGSFQVSGPTAGFRLLVRAPGHAPRITAQIARQQPEVPPIRLQTGAWIRGTVRAPSGPVRAGGLVCADPIADPIGDHGGAVRSAVESRTGPDGGFTLGPMSAGPYEVFYSSPVRERPARGLARDRRSSAVRILVGGGDLLRCDLEVR